MGLGCCFCCLNAGCGMLFSSGGLFSCLGSFVCMYLGLFYVLCVVCFGGCCLQWVRIDLFAVPAGAYLGFGVFDWLRLVIGCGFC